MTGASIIAPTYGAVPPNWRGREALDWLPRNRPPAWTILEPESSE